MEAPLPQHGVPAVAPHTADRPGLVPHLPHVGTVLGLVAFQPRHTQLSRVLPQIQRGVLAAWQPAVTPRSHLEAVGVLLLTQGTGGSSTGLRFCQVGARGTSIERRSDDGTGPVPQAIAATPATLGPGGEVCDNAVPWARHQAGLLQGWLRCQVLTDLSGHDTPVQLLKAAGAAALQAVLCHHAGSSLTAGHAGSPSRNLPLEQLQVPVADFEAPPLAFRLLLLVAVGVVGRPAFGVGAPDSPASHAPRTAVTHTSAPVTCKRGRVEPP